MNRDFYGVHERKLDYKGRLGIPDDLLTAGGPEWRRAVISRDFSQLRTTAGKTSHFLSIYDRDTWHEIMQLAHEDMDPEELRHFMLQVVGDASTVDVDTTKRITVPERMLQYASIDRQAAVIGVVDHIEVWNPEVLSAHREAMTEEEIRVKSIADIARGRIREVS